MTVIRVGLIGFGLSGRVFHYPIIDAVAGLNLVAVMERRPENRHLVPDGVRVVDTPEAIIEDPEIDLVVLAVPNAAHAGLAERCLLAGKHVVVENPFTVTEAEAIPLIGLAKRQDRLLSIYHNRRFDADFLTITRLLNEDRLGRIISYEAHFDRFRLQVKPGWREENVRGSGLVYDLGSHLIDQALCLFGEPHAICAFIRCERPEAVVPDAFTIIMDYVEGPLVTLRCTMLAREMGPRYVINGSSGSYVKRGIDVQEEQLKQGKLPLGEPDWGIEPEEHWGKLYTERDGIPHTEPIRTEDGDYRLYYENIRDAINQHRPPKVTPEAAAAVIRVIELAIRSSAEGRSLPFR